MESGKIVAREIPMKGVRKVVAQRMSDSLKKSPQATAFVKVNMANAMALLDEYRAAGEKVSFTALLVQASAIALTRHPGVNASLEDGIIQEYSSVNIGVAISGAGMLFVPVIRNANQKSLRELTQEIAQLVEKAQKRELTYTDMSDTTFTVSNMGSFDVDMMTPIINMPESAILATGSMRKEVVVTEQEEMVIAPVLYLCLTVDHAVLDGVPSSLFLSCIKTILSNPKEEASIR